jgi:hypothetical protein
MYSKRHKSFDTNCTIKLKKNKKKGGGEHGKPGYLKYCIKVYNKEKKYIKKWRNTKHDTQFKNN